MVVKCRFIYNYTYRNLSLVVNEKQYHFIYNYRHRNLILVVDDKQCRYVVSRDVMTPLSAMIRDCLAKLDQIRTKKQHQSGVHRPAEPTEGGLPPADDRKEEEEGGEREGAMCISENAEQWKLKTDAEEAELCCEALEQGLYLFWNIT